jgi:sarcosine oxidase subunit alpha
MGLLAGGRARLGQRLYVPTTAGEIAVKVASPVFYDPAGARINA